ncbi:MAG: type 1 glutamine amidotransferase [Bosea sp. (in: a-proteobacteria)]
MAAALRFLIVDGNVATLRETHRINFGMTPGESYAEVLRGVVPSAVHDIVRPTDHGANLPGGEGLASYDAVFLTGSALNLYDMTPDITRQIELMRAVYESGTPCFGSCWGIQMGAAAAGGTVHKNPKGREVGIARRITKTEAGMAHPLLAGRPVIFDAPCTHEDEVAVLPEGATLLASNQMSQVQAVEIRAHGGVFWGVQYHPEFTLTELVSILRRRRELLVKEGFYADLAAADAHLNELVALDANKSRKDLAWKLGLDAEVLEDERRTTELRNFVEQLVKPMKSARGRA